MVDIYQHDGESTTPVEIQGRQISFPKTSLMLVHTEECLQDSCDKASKETVSRVFLPGRRGLDVTAEATINIIQKQFKWAIRWVAWFAQFISDASIGGSDSLAFHLGTKRAHLIDGVAPSFALDIFKANSPQAVMDSLVVPPWMIEREFLSALFCRVYEFDLSYKGKYNPVVHLVDQFERVPDFSTDAFVAVYTRSRAAYSKGSIQEQHIKMVARFKPSAEKITLLMDWYNSHGPVTWATLNRHVQLSRQDPEEGSDKLHDIRVLQLIRAAFRHTEEQLLGTIADAGIQHSLDEVSYSVQSNIVVRGLSDVATQATCMSNCYSPARPSKQYYVFNCCASDDEQPVFCFEGVLTGHLPIAVSSQKLLDEEIRETGLAAVDMPNLTVVCDSRGRSSVKCD